MTTVFVHGVPETAEVWDPLRARLSRDSVALRLPGFGAPVPDGFASAKDEYVSWLERELAALDGPLELVGHDWGALLVARVASRSVVGLRSWAIDVAAVLHPDYVWHDAARLWQTPESGEAWATATLAESDPGSPLSATGQLGAAGVPAEPGAGDGRALRRPDGVVHPRPVPLSRPPSVRALGPRPDVPGHGTGPGPPPNPGPVLERFWSELD
ncbi:alpha/beta fold hydrolase [Streptomyces flavofungini]|uniref:Alpha/beta hydrolase n=1 Tax=Streptomyces flavofungini TaxID=68200 RepID=A0ABS0X850_9ACTN|nr:alpha/beta fold hydrolase [Streptomyces flavofungini]MBJ3809378.1 alpha/beta hydrolase [Streptomyces flavofungini]GHC77916.1 hypothetical protein GCM10010349_58900 [Streptomyces flavofungini]